MREVLLSRIILTSRIVVFMLIFGNVYVAFHHPTFRLLELAHIMTLWWGWLWRMTAGALIIYIVVCLDTIKGKERWSGWIRRCCDNWLKTSVRR